METSNSNNSAVETTVIGFLAEWQGLVHEMRWMIALAIVLILTDLWFGVRASKFRGEKVRKSRAGRRTFNKIIDYLCYLFIGITIGKAIAEPYGVDPIVTAITAMVLCYRFEIDSIYGHILELHGIKDKPSLWKLIGLLLQLKFKAVGSAINEMINQSNKTKECNE